MKGHRLGGARLAGQDRDRLSAPSGRLAELNAAEQVPGNGEQGQDHKYDKSLVDERGLEGRDDSRVVRLQRAAHA
jgi:hypothetical protein